VEEVYSILRRNALNVFTRYVIKGSVKRLRAMWLVVMALSWAPLSIHCQLEAVSGLSFLRCPTSHAAHPAPGSHCEDTGCCAWESGAWQLPASQPAVALAPVVSPVWMLPEVPEQTAPPAAVALRKSHEAPSDLPAHWQFACRAALPPRAPSRVV